MILIKLIAGLGNPGSRYQSTRHNAGFDFVDAVARAASAPWRAESKFSSEVAKITVNQQIVYLIKPQTFMNKSGHAVSAIARFYKIPVNEILVVHDELDLAPGVARFKQGGGHGGHNGLRDIQGQMGNNDYLRLRIGIGHPGQRHMVTDYVLGRSSLEEAKAIEQSMQNAQEVLPTAISGDVQHAMNTLHRSC